MNTDAEYKVTFGRERLPLILTLAFRIWDKDSRQ